MARHASRLDPANTICNTGQPAPEKGVSLASPPNAATANPVAFSTIAGDVASNSFEIVAAEISSFRLATKMGRALSSPA